MVGAILTGEFGVWCAVMGLCCVWGTPHGLCVHSLGVGAAWVALSGQVVHLVCSPVCDTVVFTLSHGAVDMNRLLSGRLCVIHFIQGLQGCYITAGHGYPFPRKIVGVPTHKLSACGQHYTFGLLPDSPNSACNKVCACLSVLAIQYSAPHRCIDKFTYFVYMYMHYTDS